MLAQSGIEYKDSRGGEPLGKAPGEVTAGGFFFRGGSLFQGETVVLAVGGDGGGVALGAGVAGDVLHRNHGVRQDLKLRRGAALHGLLH